MAKRVYSQSYSLTECWSGVSKSIEPVKKLSDDVVVWLCVVICLEQGANDLHMVQLMSLPLHHLLLH